MKDFYPLFAYYLHIIENQIHPELLPYRFIESPFFFIKFLFWIKIQGFIAPKVLIRTGNESRISRWVSL